MRRTVCRRPVATSSSKACCRLDSWTAEECLASLPTTYLLIGLGFPCFLYQTGIFLMLSLCPFYTACSRRNVALLFHLTALEKDWSGLFYLYSTHSQQTFSHDSFQSDQDETMLFSRSPCWFDSNTDALGVGCHQNVSVFGESGMRLKNQLYHRQGALSLFYRPSTLVADIKQCQHLFGVVCLSIQSISPLLTLFVVSTSQLLRDISGSSAGGNSTFSARHSC